MARKIPTSDQTSVGWKKRLATDIELQELLFTLLVVVGLPTIAAIWTGDLHYMFVSAVAFLLAVLIVCWVIWRDRREPRKRP